MSSPRRRLSRAELEESAAQRRRAQEALRSQQRALGLGAPPQVTLPNRTSSYKTVEEERRAREDAAVEQARIFRSYLPVLLRRFDKIEDVRDPKKVKHKLTVLLLYGILTFVYHMASRREANRTMTRPVFVENLKLLFPDLESIPHHDTLERLLDRIDVNEIEKAHLELVRKFIRNKKFRNYLIQNCYPIAIDGSQKLAYRTQRCEETLEREVKTAQGTKVQHVVYVLEANLAFHNGMTIPLASEFLSYAEGDSERSKQDCEQKAFHRLARRLKREFPRLSVIVLLDGLYPNGPVVELCRKLNWDFMIVLQDGSLPSVWEEVHGLKGLQAENRLQRSWRGRTQHFWWVNDIEYHYGPNQKHRQTLHVVVCEESWEEVALDSPEVALKTSRHAWISSRPLNSKNVHTRCNLGARHRWSGIESSFLVEKRQGYQYEHPFSHSWNAMRGYHYLMRLAHLFNVLAQRATTLARTLVKAFGVRGSIKFVVETIAASLLNPRTVYQRFRAPLQLRL